MWEIFCRNKSMRSKMNDITGIKLILSAWLNSVMAGTPILISTLWRELGHACPPSLIDKHANRILTCAGNYCHALSLGSRTTSLNAASIDDCWSVTGSRNYHTFQNFRLVRGQHESKYLHVEALSVKKIWEM